MSLHDTYDVAEPLGEGGMCTVRRGWHRRLERPVALKFLRPELAADPTERARFLREAKVGRQLDHPGVVRVLDLGETREGPWLALELIEGKTLAELEEQGLGEREACRLLAQVARALAHAHDQGVIHRDLKPSNVLVGTDGRARVADWGIARSIGEEGGLTKTGVILGTPDYMAPEQISGAALGPAVDTYGLGIMIFEAVAGRRPFLGSMTDVLRGHLKAHPPSLRTLSSHAPSSLVELVGLLLEKDGGRRPTATEAARVLEACAAGTEPATDVTIAVPTQRPQPGRPSRARPALLALVVLAGTGALILRALLPEGSAAAPVADLTVVDRIVAEAPNRLVVRHRSRAPLQVSVDLVEHQAQGDIALPRLELDLAPVQGSPGTVGETAVELPTPVLESATATLILSGSQLRSFEVRPSPVIEALLAPLEALSADRRINLLEGLDELRQRFPTSADAPAFASARDALLARAGLDAAWMALARRVLPSLTAAAPPFVPPRARLVTALEALEAFESAMPGMGQGDPPWGVRVSPLRGVTTARSNARNPARGWLHKSLTVAASVADGGAVFENGTSVQLLPTDLVTKIALSDVGSAFSAIHSLKFPGPFPELLHGLGGENLIERREATRAVYEFQMVNWNPMFGLEVAIDGGERRFLANTWSRSPYREDSFPEEPHLVQLALNPSPLRRGPVTIRLRPLSLRLSVSANPPRVSRPRLLVALPGATSGPWIPGP